MAASVHRPFIVVAFNANGIARQRYELSKQLQEMWPCSQRHTWNLIKGFLFQIITFIGPTDSRTEKVELPLHLEKAFRTTM
jgi:hypothetical protein